MGVHQSPLLYSGGGCDCGCTSQNYNAYGHLIIKLTVSPSELTISEEITYKRESYIY